jgi:phospholipid/cholesterol/gamma-HCH transport system substrate-binding protein
MTRRAGGRLGTAAVALLMTVALSGCQGLYGMLPGGAARGPHVYHVTVQFRDVLDLVPQSAVKVDDVTVGAVDRIWLDGWTARVRLRIEESVWLPDNAVAELRQTSLLGEKFVSLSPPTDAAPSGRLSDGDVIPLARSGRNPEVEEVLGALSLVLNGGGVAQLHTITVELNKAMTGHEGDIRALVAKLDTFIGGLAARKADIVRAIDGLDRLSGTLAAQKDQVATALDGLRPGLKELADQRAQLTRMLTSLSRLGVVGTRVIRASQADTVADLKALDPVLTELADSGKNLPGALEMLFTYPFPAAANGAVRGDFTNLRVTADIDLRGIYSQLTPTPGGPSPLPSLPTVPVPLPTLNLPSLCPTLPGLPVPPGCPTPSPTASGGGGLCPPVCLGGSAAAEPSAGRVDPSLVGLLMGGWT